MASKYNLDRVNRDDPNLGTDGGAPNKVFKMKEEQLTIPGLKLPVKKAQNIDAFKSKTSFNGQVNDNA
mgnify:CR=1 FL=1